MPESSLDAFAKFLAKLYVKGRHGVAYISKQARSAAANGMAGAKAHKRRTATIAGVLVLLIIGTSVGVSYANDVARAAEVAEASAEAKREAAASAESDRIAAAAEAVHQTQDLAAAKIESANLDDRAESAGADAKSFASPESLAALKVARDDLAKFLPDMDSGREIRSLFPAVESAMTALGTLAESQDRRYLEVMSKKSHMEASDEDLVMLGKLTCEKLDEHYTVNIMGAAGHILEDAFFDVAAMQIYCPKYQPALDSAQRSFRDGSHNVERIASPIGTLEDDIAAGTYSIGPASDCYWERTTGAGDIIDNQFITSARDGVTVTVYVGESFTTRGCGIWSRQ